MDLQNGSIRYIIYGAGPESYDLMTHLAKKHDEMTHLTVKGLIKMEIKNKTYFFHLATQSIDLYMHKKLVKTPLTKNGVDSIEKL